MSRNFIRSAVILGALVAGCGAALAQSGKYPTRPIIVVNPYQTGGGSDTVARLLQTKLGQMLGQPIVIDSKPGATGSLGSEFVARAAPDGHTLLVNNITLPINEALGGLTRFELQRDLVPIASVATVPVAIAVSTQLPIKTLKELITYANENSGKVAWSSCGNGSPQHMVGLRFTQLLKLSMIHAPYKGVRPAVFDGVSGVVPVLFTTIQNADAQVKAGKLWLLAVGSPDRLPNAPDVPTFGEAVGMKDFDAGVWFAFFAPKGTPAGIVAQLEETLLAAMADKAIQKSFLGSLDYAARSELPQQLATEIKANLTQFNQMKKDFDLKLE